MSQPEHPHQATHLLLLHAPFGSDAFGRRAEGFARWFGTPGFLIGQTVIVAAWIVANVAVIALRWDPYPFILLNLAFSLQAAYAAPLILLAQTRQADRDKAISQTNTEHRERLATATLEHQDVLHEQGSRIQQLLTDLEGRLAHLERLTTDIHSETRPPRP